LRLRLEECVDQVKAMNRIVKDIQKGNRELNEELMRTYRSHDFKTDDLNDTRTRL
jgi:chromosome segregation ATPase